MFRFARLWLIPVVLSLLVGCAPVVSSSPSQKAFQSNQPRVSAPQVSSEDQSALAEGNTAFALDLYRSLRQPEGNFFYSPYSISLALAMTYGGARGETANQMAETLHFTLPEDRLHPALNALDQELATRKDVPGQGADGKGFRLNIVNDLWGQQDYTFLPAFLDLLAKNYGAGLRGMDFKGNPEDSRKTINDYIAEKTEQRIKDLIPQGTIDAQTRLVLTNAIYFNAAWKNPFEKSLTQDAPFTLLDGSTKMVPMMRMPSGESMRFGTGDGYQAVALPYENGDLSMLILVPDAGQFEAFENGLDAARFESIQQQMQPSSVRVNMPAFKTESSFELGKTLSDLGMVDAFTPGAADFSGMDGSNSLYIGEVIHKSFVKVDEAGTEAAAATAVVMEVASAPAEPVEITIDRPFIFMILDEPTQTILFTGRVVNPE